MATTVITNYQASALNTDPLFVGAGDYRLQPTSPLIGAGNRAVQGAPRNFLGLPSSPENIGPMPVAV